MNQVEGGKIFEIGAVKLKQRHTFLAKAPFAVIAVIVHMNGSEGIRPLFDTKPRERDRTFVFGEGLETPNDPSGAQAVRLFVDPKSFLYLAGMVLDFEETLMRQGFNFINPHSTKSCGCGSSFST